jgi:dCTP deaminase
MQLPKESGILVAQQLRQLIEGGVVRAEAPVEERQLQPASLDLRLGRVAYRVRTGFLPERCTVEERVRELSLYELPLEDGAILERGHCYLVPLEESLALPADLDIWAQSNPKSSTGRLDVFTRLLADRCSRFESVPRGYAGPLWLEILPRSFSVRVQRGLCLNQLRFFAGRPELSREELLAWHDEAPLLFDDRGQPLAFASHSLENSLTMGVALAPDAEIGDVVGWRARRYTGAVDMTQERAHDPLEFFEPIRAPRDGRYIVEPEEFYIFASKERVRIPAELAAVMLPYDVGIGELRTNYAGFFDNGFGEPSGTRAVLEVRPHDVPFLVEDGQAFFRLAFYHAQELPERSYGQGGSHYQGQALELSKHFTRPTV